MTGPSRFTAGDLVHVTSIGKGVVREVRNGARYLVEVKGRHIVAAEDQLTADQSRKRRTSEPAASLPDETVGRGSSERAVSLDLHGLTVDQAITALDAFLSDAILAGSAEARVIHGRSGGRVRAAVHARLKAVTAVRSFRLDPSNPGVTLVTL